MENEEEKVTCQSLFQEVLEKIAYLEEKVAEQDRALKVCQEENTELKGKVENVIAENTQLRLQAEQIELDLDRMEQYSRRTCLIVDGIINQRKKRQKSPSSIKYAPSLPTI